MQTLLVSLYRFFITLTYFRKKVAQERSQYYSFETNFCILTFFNLDPVNSILSNKMLLM